jgi:hypothetical protein
MVYGLRLLPHGHGRVQDLAGRGRTLLEVCDLVVNLPPGCPLWLAVGGVPSLTTEAQLLRETVFRLDVLDWHMAAQGKGTKPQRIPLPQPAIRSQAAKLEVDARGARWKARQERRAGADQ